MSDLFYRTPRLTFLAIMLIVAMGIVAIETVGRQEDPSFGNVLGFVITQQPGADAARVEAQVTEPIERRLSEISQIERLRSASRPDLSTVIIELKSSLSDAEISATWSEVRDAVNDLALQMPADAFAPIFDDTRTGAYTSITALVPSDPETPLSVTTRYAEDLRDLLQGVSGAKQVRLFGSIDEEITVEVQPSQLANFGWSASRVAMAIAAADPRAGAGRVVGPAGDQIVEVGGAISDISRIREILLTVSDSGGVTRVGDIANVFRGERDPPAEMAFAEGRRGVVVAVMMDDGLQVDSFMADVQATMDVFDASLPGGLEHLRLFDQSTYTHARLSDLGGNLLTSFALVIAVLFVTLGLRSAMVVAVAMPLVSLGTMATLAVIGISIDQMSVAGLIVALGMLVDAAIVMVDEICKRFDSGSFVGAEVGEAVRLLAVPLAASTMTTVLAFLPMALLPGPPGDFLSPMATVVIVMLIWSFAVACTITPALSGWALTPRPDRRITLFSQGLQIAPLAALFRASLVFTLGRPRTTVIYCMILPLAGFALLPTLVEQFFPSVDRDQFYIEVDAASGSGIAATEKIALQVDAILAAEPRIKSRIWAIGRSPPPFYYNMLDNRERLPGYGAVLVTTVSPEASAQLIPELQTRLDAELLDARLLVRELIQGPPSIAPVELRITGPDLETLKALGEAALPTLSGLAQVTHARMSLGSGPPKVKFVLDETKVLSAGLTLDDVVRELEAALTGAAGGGLIEGVERLPIRVRLSADARGDFDMLRTLTLIPPNGSAGVPISTLGTMTVVPSAEQITRHDNERVNTLELFPRPGVLPQSVVDAGLEALDTAGLTMPPGFRIEIGGDTDTRALTIENLQRPFPVLLALAAATFLLTFNSFRLALVAGFSCVLFAGLSIFSVAAFGFALGITAVVGIIGSIGVSINDTIIVLNALQANERATRGDIEAATDTVLGSCRHVLSTTITTMVGFLPLALGGGDFWPPLATAIVGGVALSTIITLYLAPALFVLTYARDSDAAVKSVDPNASPAQRR
jgi:multidrug efflux pump subunit AcrB